MSEKPHTALKIMRRKIDRIELQPGKTTCNIKLKLFVDDVKMYKQEVKAGGSLVWDDVLTCDVWDGTKITIKFTMKPAGLLSRVFASKVPDIVQDFYVDGAEGSTEDKVGVKLNSHSHQLCVRGKLSQLSDEESEKFVEDTLPVIRGISRELQGYKDKLTRMHVTSAFRGPTKYNKSLKNYYRIVRLFSGGQSDILKDMVQVIKTSNIVPRCEESLKTIQLWELASHDLHNKVFFIENCKYKTGVRVPTMASGESLTGSISCKEETIGRKWRFMKNDGAADNWYLIRSEDHENWYAGVGDDYVELRDTQTWWALEPVEEHTGRYIIKQRNKDFCWNLEDTEHGTPVRLKQCANKDESNHWTLRFADD